MFKNLLASCLRHLTRRIGYSLIHVAGLGIGLTCCLLVGLYVNHELSYDRFFQNADRIYRVVTDETEDGELMQKARSRPDLAVPLKSDIPEMEEVVRLAPTSMLLARGSQRFFERQVLLADSNVFKLFSYPVAGVDANKALTKPNTIVLTAAAAQKYFGSEDPIGQSLLADGKTVLTVTGIMNDVPANTHLPFDMLVALTTMEHTEEWKQESHSSWLYTYVRLAESAQANDVTGRFPTWIQRRFGFEPDHSWSLSLERLTDIYLKSDRIYQRGSSGSVTNLYLFSCIALFILALAVVNFISLTTARSHERIKEIGIRKAVGSSGRLIAGQFILEACLLTLTASFFAVVLTELSLPAFRIFTDKPSISGITGHPAAWAMPIFSLILGAIAGIYPGLAGARFPVLSILKGNTSTPSRRLNLRTGLVVFQYAIAIALIGATIVAYTQLRFIREFDMGFAHEKTLIIDYAGSERVWSRSEAIKHEFKQKPFVTAVSVSSDIPGRSRFPTSTEIEGSDGTFTETGMIPYLVDFDFVRTYKLPLVSGRTFSIDRASDSTSMVINETAARLAGFRTPSEAIGKRYRVWGHEGHIIGVIKDFHFKSLHESVEPLWMRISPVDFRFFSLRLEGPAGSRNLAELETVWNRVAPDVPFQYRFLDDRLDDLYTADQRFSRLFVLFTLLAVGIACLGVFGLAAHATVRRTREIGIRKALGASTRRILWLLVYDFVGPLSAGFVIAAPLTWLLMSRWLDGFAYRTSITSGVFLLSGGLAVFFTLIAVGGQSIRAARTSPVTALRNE